MELIRKSQIKVLRNSDVASHQLLFPENSSSSRVTITRVHIAPGATNPIHSHDSSEQVWVALSGDGMLLLGEDESVPFAEGDVVRFVETELHGITNTGEGDFIYLSVTAPPQNFREAYERNWSS